MKKIMFDDRFGLTQAVLEGRKDMTRRFAKKVLVEDEDGDFRWNGEFEKPRYKVGEIVAVAQSYHDARLEEDHVIIQDIGQNDKMHIDASCTSGWTNKMFVQAHLMPHQIRITAWRREHLQDISDEDCLREGIYRKTCCPPGDIDYFYHSEPRSKYEVYPTPRDAFAGLIDKMAGKRTWDSNPWVDVYEFELVK